MFLRLFALFFPFFLTLNYFIILADAPAGIQKTAYGTGKFIQFALPVFWFGLVCRERLTLRPFTKNGMCIGIVFAVLAAAAMLVLYFGFLAQPGGVFAPDAPARQSVIEKMRGFGIADGRIWLLLGLFYSVIHSGLEEYYWRWFVYKKLLPPTMCSTLTASAGFTLHHILLLGTYFGFASVYCWTTSFGVFVGGLFWCQLYRRSSSIWAVWLSHGIVDAAIFITAYFICR
jgi:membrane protease YdiL (CAAX protease family)